MEGLKMTIIVLLIITSCFFIMTFITWRVSVNYSKGEEHWTRSSFREVKRHAGTIPLKASARYLYEYDENEDISDGQNAEYWHDRVVIMGVGQRLPYIGYIRYVIWYHFCLKNSNEI